MSKSVEVATNHDLIQFLRKKEHKYIKLLRAYPEEPLEQASSLNCYSMTVVLAFDLQTHTVGIQDMFAMEGVGKGLTIANGHAILGLALSDGFSYADGTVWQVFPAEEHIKVGGPYTSVQKMAADLQSVYTGVWEQKRIPRAFLTPEGNVDNRWLITSKKKRPERQIRDVE